MTTPYSAGRTSASGRMDKFLQNLHIYAVSWVVEPSPPKDLGGKVDAPITNQASITNNPGFLQVLDFERKDILAMYNRICNFLT